MQRKMRTHALLITLATLAVVLVMSVPPVLARGPAIRMVSRWAAGSKMDYTELISSLAVMKTSHWTNNDTSRAVFDSTVYNEDTKPIQVVFRLQAERVEPSGALTFMVYLQSYPLIIPARTAAGPGKIRFTNCDLNEGSEVADAQKNDAVVMSDMISNVTTTGSLPTGTYKVSVLLFERASNGSLTQVDTSSMVVESKLVGPPGMNAPTGKITSVRPTFRWMLPDVPSKVRVKSLFRLEKDGRTVYEATIPQPLSGFECRYDLPQSFGDLAGGTYTWSVTLVDGAGESFQSATATFTLNTPPTVSIEGAAPDEPWWETDTVTFTASATDAEDGVVRNLTWKVNGAVVGSGITLRYAFQNPGTYDVSVTATDSLGDQATATRRVTIRANSAPVPKIVQPPDGAVYIVGDRVDFAGEATDADGHIVTLRWLINGADSSSEASFQKALTAGTYTISLSASDGRSKPASTPAKRTITVVEPLKASIATPSKAVYNPQEPINLSSSVSGGLKPYMYRWNVDGSLVSGSAGAGATFSPVGLSAGNHTIGVTVTDAKARELSAQSVLFRINDIPAVSLSSPGEGVVYPLGAAITFGADARDSDTLTYTWTLDGSSVGGASFARTNLTSGYHTVSVKVRDPYGLEAYSASVKFYINKPPAVAITSPTATNWVAGDVVPLVAAISDDADDASTVVWTLGGRQVGEGLRSSLDTQGFAPGTYTLEAIAEDSHKAIGKAAKSIAIGPALSVSLQQASAQVVNPGTPVAFVPVVAGGLAPYTYSWYDGGSKIREGTDATFSSLPVGVHTIRLTVRDASGLSTYLHQASSEPLSFRVNDTPVVTIMTPTDGLVVIKGKDLVVSVSVQNQDVAKLEFTLDGKVAAMAEVGGVGAANSASVTLSTSSLSSGHHEIGARATDPWALSGEARRVGFMVNAKPIITSITPDGGAFLLGTELHFSVMAQDDPGDTLSYRWTVDGTEAGTGQTMAKLLTVGEHTIAVSVTDSYGESDSRSVKVRLSSEVSVVVTAPRDGQVVQEGAPLALTASAASPAGISEYRWTSSKDGQVGATNPANVTLSMGTHDITVYVKDAAGAESISPAITVVVNSKPVVTLSGAERTASVGDAVALRAQASDADGDSLSYTWSIAGRVVGREETYIYTSVTAGDIPVQVTVNDGRGGEATVSTILKVSPALSLSLDASTAAPVLNPGVPLALMSRVTGGLGEYTYSWTLGAITATTERLTVATAALAAGDQLVSLVVKDGSGHTAMAQYAFRVNDMPSVEISSPVEGAIIPQGVPVAASIVVVDVDSATSGFAISWAVDGQAATPELSGGSYLFQGMSPGRHILVVTATDPYGLATSKALHIIVNAKPVLTLSSSTRTAYIVGEAVKVVAVVTDSGDFVRSARYRVDAGAWIELTGATSALEFTIPGLGVGDHTIELSATDSNGAESDTALMKVSIATDAIAVISAPAQGAVFNEGDAVGLWGSATSSVKGDMKYRWSSSLSRALGDTVNLEVRGLAVGIHTLTFEAIDANGSSVRANPVTIRINAKPKVTLTNPGAGYLTATGRPIQLAADATDSERSLLVYAWYADDLKVADGPTASYNFDTPGLHILKVTVRDADGAIAEASVPVQVSPALHATIVGFVQDGVIPSGGAAPGSLKAEITGGVGPYQSLWSLDGREPDLADWGALTPGPHSLALRVVDAQGVEVQAAPVIFRVNTAPQVQINSPAVESLVYGTPIRLVAAVFDDPGDTHSYQWSLDGKLVSEAEQPSLTDVAPGLHTIEVVVVDRLGASAQAVKTVRVLSVVTVGILGDAVVSVEEGAAGQLVGVSSSVTPGAIGLVWRSSISGEVGSGQVLNLSGLVVGEHSVTLTAGDAAGAMATSDSVLVRVAPKSVTSSPVVQPDPIFDDQIRLEIPAQVVAGVPVAVRAFVGDRAGETHSVVWKIDGQEVDTGVQAQVTFISPGIHSLDAIATYSSGRSVSASTTVSATSYVLVGIASPVEGSTHDVGQPVDLNATASSPAPGQLCFSWSSNLDGVIGTDEVMSVSSLSPGQQLLTLSVADAVGAMTSKSVRVTVNGAPTVTLDAPTSGATFPYGRPISFVATGSDINGDALVYDWWVTNSGEVILTSFGAPSSLLSPPDLMPGSYEVAVTARDPRGLAATSATVSFEVLMPPAGKVTITSPERGFRYAVGAGGLSSLRLAATMEGSQGGDASPVTYSWRVDDSTVDGASVSRTLSFGYHSVDVMATDIFGREYVDSVEFRVIPAEPLQLLQPTSGQIFTGGAITFKATALDLDGNSAKEDACVWSSSRDGELGRGLEITRELTIGDHTITFTLEGLDSPVTMSVSISVDEFLAPAPTAMVAAIKPGTSAEVLRTSDSFGQTLTEGMALGAGDLITVAQGAWVDLLYISGGARGRLVRVEGSGSGSGNSNRTSYWVTE